MYPKVIPYVHILLYFKEHLKWGLYLKCWFPVFIQIFKFKTKSHLFTFLVHLIFVFMV